MDSKHTRDNEGASQQAYEVRAVRRRTLAGAAAWSLPVITVGTAAPARAASGTSSPCPTVAAGTSWSTSKTGGSGVGGAAGWGGSPLALTVSEDAGTGGPLTLTSSTTITGLIPGQSYPFNVLVKANYGNDSVSTSSGATVQVAINGRTYFQRSTRGTANPLLIVTNSTSTTYTAYPANSSFVATATTATLTYTVTVAARGAGQNASDDIRIQAPQWINCAGATASPLVSCPTPMSSFPSLVTNGSGNSGTGTLNWDNLGGNPGTSSGTLAEWSAFRDSAPSGQLTATTTGTMTGLIAGQTYTMAFNIKATFGNNNKSGSLHSVIRVFVGGTTGADASVSGGTTIFQGDTRSVADGGISGFTVLDTGSGRYAQYLATFTASASSMSVAYQFTASWSAIQTPDDDIQITVPQFINCA